MKTKISCVWVVTATDFDGTFYGPWVFFTKPKKKVLEKFIENQAECRWAFGISDDKGHEEFWWEHIFVNGPTKVKIIE